MTIKEVVTNKLNSLDYKDVIIISIDKVGSQLFIENAKDIDIKVVCLNYPKDFERFHIVDGEANYDVLFMELGYFDKCMSFNSSLESVKYNQLYNYFYAFNNLEYGTPLLFDFIGNRETYLKFIKEHYVKRYTVGRLSKNMGKAFVHYYIILEMYKNNKVEITDDMKEVINKLYNVSEDSIGIIRDIADEIERIGED